MLIKKRNFSRALISNVILLIFACTIKATTANTPTKTPTAQQPLNSVTPTGIFQLPNNYYDAVASGVNSIFDDFDDYVPYRSDLHDNFSWELLKDILQEEQYKNVVISPFSVKLVLALLSEAAGNNTQTQKELFSALSDIKSPDNQRGFYKKILSSLKKENPYHLLNLETKLYTDWFIEANQRYSAILRTFYDTEIERLEFADSLNAANTINAWCSNVTHGHLQQLVNADAIQNTVMLLANAIYFNGLWRREFNDTYQNVFFKSPEQQIHANYMEQTEYFYYYNSNELDAKILRLPYKGKKFSMFIILPRTKYGVEELLSNLLNEQVKRMQFMMEEIKIKVTIPKFKFDFNKNLKETLQHLGVHDIFTDNASLPGLARGADVANKLKVSNIFQKAGIDVNEKGTEAYAATVVEIENKFGGSSTIEEFNANRPFIFFIEEEATGNILFAGKVSEPTL